MPSDTFAAGIEAAARVIEPYAWRCYDATLAPFLESRGAHEGEGWHVRAYQAGCRSADDARRWWLETADDVEPYTIQMLRSSLTKAAAIRRLTPTASEATAIGAGEDVVATALMRSMMQNMERDVWDGLAAASEPTASPKVASDTAPGVREAVEACARWLDEISTNCDITEIVADGGITAGMVVQQEAREQRRRLLAALSASPTASDTDTAIPGGALAMIDAWEKEWLASPDPHWGDSTDWGTARDIARRLAAASPKPDTDTPVDPSVEGVREAEEVERDIRIAIWNAGMASAMGQNRTQAFIRRAMAEPMMARALAALAALAAKPIAGMDAGES